MSPGKAPVQGDKTGRVLVLGAGIAGIRASLDVAAAGYEVLLVDSAPAMGGVL
ncbi:MAG TPA: FAD-binding protein, partial [Polyangiaceae bacterium]|nr:FAD-binding protein [Polyangiaceae bacterium]